MSNGSDVHVRTGGGGWLGAGCLVGERGLAVALRRQRIRLLIFWGALLAAPLVAPNEYILSLCVMFFINLQLVAGLNLVLGYAGQISLCHAAFFGLGAYTSGILSARMGLPFWLGICCAVTVTTVGAIVIAVPALRLRGNYLAMATLGFNAIISVMFTELVSLTGGPNGLLGIQPPSLFGAVLDTPARFFPLAWLVTGLAMFLMLNLVASRYGRALRAVAAGEIAAGALGIDAYRLKLGIFALAAGLAGVAGALYAHFNLFVSPETCGFFSSVLLVVMVALGGWGNYWGPVLGALIYTAVPELLRKFHDAELFIFGLCMIGVLLYARQGLVGLFSKGRSGCR